MSSFSPTERAEAIAILRDELQDKIARAQEQTSEHLIQALWQDVFETARVLKYLKRK